MDYRKKLMEYKKSIGATTTSTISRTVAFKDLSANINESDNQNNFSQLCSQPQHRLQSSSPLSVEDNNHIHENRQSVKRELNSIGASIVTPIMRTVSFRESASDLDELDNQNNASQLHFQQQSCKLLNVKEENTIRDDKQSATKESNVLRISSPSPSPQPQSHQMVLPTPGHPRGSSYYLEPIGLYVNWNSHHGFLASQPWCCIGDLIALCDKYECKAISASDAQLHANIVREVCSLLNGKAPFDMRRRFPGCIRNMENLLVCIGRCPSIEYHLQRILTAFRRPLNKLSIEKQNTAKQNFHLAVRELHLDVSARISEIKLYDRNVFEKEFHLKWQDHLE